MSPPGYIRMVESIGGVPSRIESEAVAMDRTGGCYKIPVVNNNVSQKYKHILNLFVKFNCARINLQTFSKEKDLKFP